MLTKQFHDEAVHLERTSRLSRLAGEEVTISDTQRTTVLTLVIRLLLNGWITDKEKIYLDSLPPTDCLTFLMHGKSYMHPEELELFPFEVIETTSLHGGEAIFSHRYRSNGLRDTHQQYRIFSAAINPQESEKIILGFFGPSHRLGSLDEDCRFTRLVNEFRRAHRAISDDMPTLGRQLKRKQATILVSRASGRILALNQAALGVFKRTDRAMVDITLDQLKYHLAPLLPDYNLTLENVTAADLGLSVVTLEPNCGRQADHQDIVHQLINQFNACAASIGLAESRLEKISFDSDDGESRGVVETIHREANDLNLAARQFAYLAGYDSTEPATQNIPGELEKALGNLDSEALSGLELKVKDTSGGTPFEITAPQGACRILFESILHNHLRRLAGNGKGKILLEKADCGTSKLRFSTSLGADTAADAIRNTGGLFVEHLATRLGLGVTKNLSIQEDTLVTELTLNRNE
jgi:hypothetical protein